jgi:amino acid transporter
MSLFERLMGRPLATCDEAAQKVGPVAGIPMLGLDALSSAAYGPEAALTILLPLGALGIAWIGPLTALILALLAILYLSYRQTIPAYPNGGGSYTVARENLGERPGLLAAASLMLDYILNVAVGIAAGVGALISAVPALQPYILPLCLAVLALITLVNLRGVRESGTAFVIPTYLFLSTLGIVLVLGLYRSAMAGGHPIPVEIPPAMPAATGGVTLWLLMRAFANGCTAMTGVEAISNGITAFAAPAVANAKRTLTAVIALLGALLAGIAYLCHVYNIGATDPNGSAYQSVLSELTAAVAGRGIFYYVTMGSVIAVVCLSANTSFADFPRLCRLLALDNYLPYAFAVRGRRLVYSQGIIILAAIAGVLLIAFGGITDRLIPLFAVGAFSAFTLSQAGMVMHWRRQIASGVAPAAARASLVINGFGAVLTFAVLLVVLATKFLEGAWMIILLAAGLLALFIGIKRHYSGVAAQTALAQPLDVKNIEAPVVVVIMRQWSIVSEKALRFALSLSTEVIAIHVNSGDDEGANMRRNWSRYVEAPLTAVGMAAPRLLCVQSPFRRLFNPLFDTLRQIEDEHPIRMVAVIIPELVGFRWYDYLLHNQLTTALKAALLFRGDSRISIVNVPWYLRRSASPQSAGFQPAAAKIA